MRPLLKWIVCLGWIAGCCRLIWKVVGATVVALAAEVSIEDLELWLLPLALMSMVPVLTMMLCSASRDVHVLKRHRTLVGISALMAVCLCAKGGTITPQRPPPPATQDSEYCWNKNCIMIPDTDRSGVIIMLGKGWWSSIGGGIYDRDCDVRGFDGKDMRLRDIDEDYHKRLYESEAVRKAWRETYRRLERDPNNQAELESTPEGSMYVYRYQCKTGEWQ